MNLYIDTADFGQITFALSDGKKLFKKVFKVDAQKSHQTLGKLEEFLKSTRIKSLPDSPQDLGRETIKKIYVNKGPGSYTGVRVGVVMAQALGLAWGVKVVPKSKLQMSKLFK